MTERVTMRQAGHKMWLPWQCIREMEAFRRKRWRGGCESEESLGFGNFPFTEPSRIMKSLWILPLPKCFLE